MDTTKAIEEYERMVSESGFEYILSGDLVAQVRADQQEAWNALIVKAEALDRVMAELEART
jgi:hypothetical protein